MTNFDISDNEAFDPSFVDRRSSKPAAAGVERRQFGNTHSRLSPDARELAEAIDAYKLKNRRRYITFEEMLGVIETLGYTKQTAVVS